MKRKGHQDGSESCWAPSTHNSQQAQHPWLSQVLSSVFLEIPDPGTITAAARIEGLPFQLPWAQVLPHSTCQPHHLGLFWGRLCQRSSFHAGRGSFQAGGCECSWELKEETRSWG